jgi:hypothetical protein
MMQIKEEETAATLAKRKEAAGRIEELKKERDETLMRLRAERDESEEKATLAKAALDAATSARNEAARKLSAAGFQFDNAIRLEELTLNETAAPEIDKAITFFRERLDFLRKPGRISTTNAGAELNLVGWKKNVRVQTNNPAIKQALAYCLGAIAQLEGMKLNPELDADTIDQLRAELPSIEVYTEFQGEKPLERAPGPRDGLPSDDEMAWRFGTLMEKAGKLLRR